VAGHTISTHTDDQIVSAALRFYTKLPPEAHAAIRTIEAFATAEEEARIMRDVVRALAAAELEISKRRMAAQLRLEDEAQLDSDDAILAEAVRLTRRR